MKFVITLPIALAKCLQPLGISQKGQWIWEDKATPMLRLYSPEQNPFGQEWTLQPSEISGKSDKTKYASRLDLKLFPPEQALAEGVRRCGFARERYKAKFPSFKNQILYGVSFPVEKDQNNNPIMWVNYCFLPKENQ